jgi:translocation and assembly module TamA
VSQFNVILKGDSQKDPEFQSLMQNLPLHKGDIFNHTIYEDFKANLAKLAAERGYFSARFVEHRVEIDLDSYEARINLLYDGGRRYHFGDVELTQDVLDPARLQLYIPFKKGDPYTLNAVLDLQQALNDSDYFQRVEVSPGQPNVDLAEIPISVLLTPRKRNRYSLGLGYGSDTGARAKLGWQIPRVNRLGHRFNSEAKYSQLGYSISGQYRVPVFNPRTDQIVYSAGLVTEKTDTSESTVRSIGSSLNRSRNHWRESISINYQREEFIIANDKGISSLLIPGVNWSRTWGNNLIFSLGGLRFDFGLRGASKHLGSDTDFMQMQGGIKAINALGKHARIIARGRLGGTKTQEFNQLPSSVRFFAGGAQSVRGYSYQSLGPVDENGDVIGGKNLMIGSIELERSINDSWALALFYDGGNAIDNLADKLERGAGFGIRWKSPVGPVRIDLASAVSRDGQPWRLHINIGPDL